MTTQRLQIPPGPAEPYPPSEDLFDWMNANFARHGDIYQASIYGTRVYVVSNPEYCEHILRANWQNYPRKGQVVKRIALLLGNGLIASNGDFWVSQRRMVQTAFTKQSIDEVASHIVRVNAKLLRDWKSAARRGQEVNVTRDVSLVILEITLVAIFGDDYQKARPYFDVLAEGSDRNLQFAQALRLSAKVILEIIAERRSRGATATDFLGKMMQARDRQTGEAMPDPQLTREVMTLVVAGHETSAGLLNWLWYLLSRSPETQAGLIAEFDAWPWDDAPAMDQLARYAYTRQVIEEALRLYPPLWLMTRKSLDEDHLGPFHVPAGTEIYISPYLIQRSPDLWEAPDDFDPARLDPRERSERPELALCPFGAGPRKCIGEPFARAEMQIHLMMIARELTLRYDEAGSPQIATGMNLLSKHDLMMLPQIRTVAAGRL